MGALGIIWLFYGFTLLSSIFPGHKPIAISAAFVWIVSGIMLAAHAGKTPEGIAGIVAEGVLADITVFGAPAFRMSLAGGILFVRIWSIRFTNVLIALSAPALFLVFYESVSREKIKRLKTLLDSQVRLFD
jgi:hypothetical protein